MAGDTPSPTRVFSPKSAESLENKRVEFSESAKECARISKQWGWLKNEGALEAQGAEVRESERRDTEMGTSECCLGTGLWQTRETIA
jgi:hypothetical protein